MIHYQVRKPMGPGDERTHNFGDGKRVWTCLDRLIPGDVIKHSTIPSGGTEPYLVRQADGSFLPAQRHGNTFRPIDTGRPPIKLPYNGAFRVWKVGTFTPPKVQRRRAVRSAAIQA